MRVASALGLDDTGALDDAVAAHAREGAPGHAPALAEAVARALCAQPTQGNVSRLVQMWDAAAGLDALGGPVRACVAAHVGLCVAFPDMFPQPAGAGDADALLDAAAGGGRPGLLAAVAAAQEDAEETRAVFGPLLGAAARRLYTIGVLDAPGALPLIDAARDALVQPGVAAAMHDSFVADPAGCVLGAMHAVGLDATTAAPALQTLLPQAALPWTAGDSPPAIAGADADAFFYAVRSAQCAVQDAAGEALLALARTGAPGREVVLSWLAALADANRGRMRMRADPRTLSPERVVWGALGSLLRLARPFTRDASHAKLSSIGPLCRPRTRHDADPGTTRLACASAADAAAYLARHAADAPLSFVGDVFHLCVHFFRLAAVRAVHDHGEVLRALHETRAALRAPRGDDAGAALHRLQLLRLRNALFVLDARLLDATFLDDAWALVDLLCDWLAQSAAPDSEHVRMLPEHYAECAGEWVLFCARHVSPRWWAGRSLDRPVALLGGMLDRAEVIRSAHLRASFVDVLHALVLDASRPEADDVLGADDGVVDAPPAPGHFAGALCAPPARALGLGARLMRLYVEVEATGAASQFYDKFRIRHAAAAVLRHLLSVESTRRDILAAIAQSEGANAGCCAAGSPSGSSLGASAPPSNCPGGEKQVLESTACDRSDTSAHISTESGLSVFLRFANLLLNDATYLLDEAIAKLREIREHEARAADGTQPAAPEEPPFDRARTERAASSCLLLGTSALDLMAALAALRPVRALFLRPEIRERLARMLAANLAAMAGPGAAASLKVADPAAVHWRPAHILGRLVDLLLLFGSADINSHARLSSGSAAFCVALGTDSRSFSPDLVERTASLLRRHAMRPEQKAAALEALLARISALTAAESDAADPLAALLEDADFVASLPDEFVDPLLCTPMRDPVVLARTSRKTVDRASITAHLLNDATDPFNRMPLSLSDVVPDDALRARIDAHLQSALAQRRSMKK